MSRSGLAGWNTDTMVRRIASAGSGQLTGACGSFGGACDSIGSSMIVSFSGDWHPTLLDVTMGSPRPDTIYSHLCPEPTLRYHAAAT